ncbi:MAG TPA: four helix bundle protein [Candidatus Hypogeohydataceae bacterium YC38]
MGIERFEDLEVWQISRELVREVYKLTENPEFSKDFGLKDQVKRSVVSIMSNIAEAGRQRNLFR